MKKSIYLLFFLFLAEIWIKYIMNQWRPQGDMTAILTFDFMANENISYGISLGPQWLQMLLIFIVFSWIVYLAITYYKQGRWGVFFGLGLMCVGALSNIFDRFVYGYVIDYLSFWPLAPWGRFPTFNGADVSISLGLIITIYYLSIHSKLQKTKNPLK